MNIREWINRNPFLVAPAVVLVVAVVFLLMPGGSERPPLITTFPVWLFDESTGGYSVADNQTPGIRAAVFSCGDCSNADSRFVGFLVREDGFVRGLDEDTWHHGMSPPGQALNEKVRQRCEQQGGSLTICHPPRSR